MTIIGILFLMKNIMTGFYLPAIDYIYCTDQATCNHEIAHRMDTTGGNISESPEYQSALENFILQQNDETWSGWFSNNSWREKYAQFYERAGGEISNMPPELIRFYQ